MVRRLSRNGRRSRRTVHRTKRRSKRSSRRLRTRKYRSTLAAHPGPEIWEGRRPNNSITRGGSSLETADLLQMNQPFGEDVQERLSEQEGIDYPSKYFNLKFAGEWEDIIWEGHRQLKSGKESFTLITDALEHAKKISMENLKHSDWQFVIVDGVVVDITYDDVHGNDRYFLHLTPNEYPLIRDLHDDVNPGRQIYNVWFLHRSGERIPFDSLDVEQEIREKRLFWSFHAIPPNYKSD